MRAMLLNAPAAIEEHPLHLADVEGPTPGPGEIVVRVAACGVCRSNLHMVEGDWLDAGNPAFLPIIPGHEFVGSVVAVGEGVEGLVVGQRVGVGPLWSTCGRCEYCLTGRDQLCQSKHITGETVHGGYAEYALAKATHAYPVPASVGDTEAAPLFCPGLTAFASLAKAKLAPGKRVAVFGVGGVGHMVVQFAALMGADVVAVSRSRQHLELAEELGATDLVDASRTSAVSALSNDGGVDAAIVFAPSDEALRQAVHATKPGGVIVTGVNAAPGALPFADEKVVVGSILGSRWEMKNVLDLAATAKVHVVCDSYPLEEANEVLTRLKRGEVRARAALVV